MSRNILRNWIKNLGEKLLSGDKRRSRQLRSGVAKRQAVKKIRPNLESLEDRLTPSPVVTLNTANIPDNSATIIINGSGFDPNPANDTVAFNAGVTGTVTAATASQLTVTITTPPTLLAPLDAVVTADAVNSGAPVEVANAVNSNWIVTDPNGNLGSGSLNDVTLPYAVANALSGDSITFSASLSGHTVTLSNTLTINSDVSITGLAAGNPTVSGNNAVQVFNVPAVVAASISDLTIENGVGVSGGGIYNAGNLTLSNDTFSADSASANGGGICNSGYLNSTNDTFNGNSAANGGGIYNSDNLYSTNDSFTGNSAAASGAGIANTGYLTLSGGTFTSNSALGNGGGVANSGTVNSSGNNSFTGNTAADGGGIYNASTLYLSNDTIAGNTAADGGGIYNSGLTSANLSTVNVSGNSATSSGGGIYNSGTAHLSSVVLTGNMATLNGGAVYTAGGGNTYFDAVVSGNTAASGSGVYDAGNGTLTISGYGSNTISDNIVCQGTGGLTLAGGGTIDISGNIDLGSGNLIDSSTGQVTISGVISGTATSGYAEGLVGTYFNLPWSTGLIQPATPSNTAWLGNQTPAVTAELVGPIDFPDIADNGFLDTQGNQYYNLGAGNNNNVEARWYGNILIPGTGTTPLPINFATTSDDGSMLYIDGNPVVFNDYNQGATEQIGFVYLTPGVHSIDIEYSQGNGGASMVAQWEPYGTDTFVNIPVSAFVQPGLIKTGTGTLTLSDANTYAGATTINAGTLVAAADGAMGPASAAGIVVAAGADLALSGGIDYTTAEPITINGSGPAGNGAIESINGTNSFDAPITLSGAATVGCDAGALTLGGDISTGASALTLAGGGNININGNINSQGGGITLAGSGTASIAGSINAAQGNVTVTNSGGGTLDVSGNIGAAQGSVTLDNTGSGTIDVTGNISVSGRLVLAGSGTIDVSGNVDLGATGNVIDSSSGQATISGVISGTATSPTGLTQGLNGAYFNINNTNTNDGPSLIQPAAASNAAWLGNQTPAVTAPLVGPIDFSDIQQDANAMGFTDTLGNTYYDLNPTPGAGANNNVEARWYGQIMVPGTGTTPVPINFATSSDDGSMLYIDGNAVVYNNYYQGVTQRTGLAYLTPGAHTIDVEYFQGGGGAYMDARWDPTGGNNFVDIPNSAFFSIQPVNSVTMAGTGTLTLSNANTYIGATTINSGTLVATADGAMGPATAAGVFVNRGGDLALTGGLNYATAEPITITGSGPAGNGAIENISGTNTLDAPITLSGSALIGCAAGTMNLGGDISLGDSQTTLTLTGSGNINVTGNIDLGLLGNLADAGSGQDTISGVISGTAESGTADLQGLAGAYFNITAAQNLIQPAATSNPAWLGNQTPAVTAQLIGPIDFPDIQQDGNAMGFTDPLGNTYYNLNPTPGAGDNNNVEARWYGQIMIPGTGTTPVPINFATSSDDGSMLYINGNAVVSNNNFQGVTQRTGLAYLTPGLHNIDVEYYQGGGGAYMDAQWDPTGGSNFVDIPNSAFSSVEPVNSVTKTGTGTLTLSNTNTYLGATTVNAGTLIATADGAMGPADAGGIFVHSGGALGFAGGVDYTTAEQTTISGSGPAGNGAIENIGGTNTFDGPISLSGNTVIGSVAGDLTLGGGISAFSSTLTLQGAGTTNISGNIICDGGGVNLDASGTIDVNGNINLGPSGNLTDSGSGQATVSGVISGTSETGYAPGLVGTYFNIAAAQNLIQPAVSSNTAWVGNQTPAVTAELIGPIDFPNIAGNGFADSVGNPAYYNIPGNNNNVEARWYGDIMIPGTGTTPVPINFATASDDGSMLYIDGNAVVYNNYFQGVTQRTGLAYLTPGLHAIDIEYYNGGGGAAMDAQWDTSGGSNFVDIPNSAFFQPANGVIKNGTGTLTLSNTNNYIGATTINAGTLVATANGAMGPATAGGVTVNTGGALALSGGVNYTTAEPTTIRGSGPAGNGAMENISGTNTFAGSVTLSGSATIGADAGTMNLSGNFADGSYTLTAVGAGITNIQGDIQVEGGGRVSMTGTGTLNVSGNINFQGSGTVTLGGTGVINVSGNVYLGSLGNFADTGSGQVTVSGVISGTAESGSIITQGLIGTYFNIGANQNLIQPAAPSNSNWLGNQTPAVTAQLVGPIDFPDIQGEADSGVGFTDTLGNTYYNLDTSFGQQNNNNVEARWYGDIMIPGTGTTPRPINFSTSSDDGSMLYIDGNAVVSSNNFQGVTQRTGLVSLTPGLHAIDIEYYNGGGGAAMIAQWDPTGSTNFVDIPNSALFTVELTNSLTKTGSGTLTLANTNSYIGATAVNGGTLVVTADGAMGPAYAAGISVNTGGALAFTGGLDYTTAEAITITGSGPAGHGAIENISGTNVFAIPITLSGAATVGSDAGTMTLGGDISTGTNMLTVVGAGTTDISGNIDCQGYGVTLDATGTINVSGNINLGLQGNVTDSSSGQDTISGVISGTAASAYSVGLTGTYFNIPANQNLIQPAAASNAAWLGNQAPAVTAELVGPIDFPNIQANGFADSVGDPAYYNLGNGNNNNVEARWYGPIMIPGTGTTPVPINFATTSDDGSTLYIDGNLVVSNNYFQGATRRTGLVDLTPGLHTIDIEYYNGGGGATMDAQWDPTGGTNFVDIPISAFAQSVNGVIKNGSGTLTLSNTNAYIGATTIDAGHLVAAADGAMGPASAAGIVVNAGGALAFTGGLNYTTVEPTTISGSGPAGNGAIENISGSNTFGAPVTLASADATIGSDAGTLTLAYPTLNMLPVSNLTTTGPGNIDIPNAIQAAPPTVPSAYVGFTGGTGGLNSVQDILNWTYADDSTTYEDYSGGFAPNNLVLNNGASIQGTALQLTDGNNNEARTAWTPTKVPIDNFTSTFQWTYGNVVSPQADGFTFAVQNAGPTAVGNTGYALGYYGIPGNSLAVEFNTYTGSGTGSGSDFGVDVDGVINHPIDLTPYGINFQANPNDVFQAMVTDNGTGTVTVSIWDTTQNSTENPPNYTQTFTIFIPPTDYVGFTGGTGGLNTTQNILNWTYNSGATNIDYSGGFASNNLVLNNGATVQGTALQLTDGNNGEATTAWTPTPVPIGDFTSTFQWTYGNGSYPTPADGFTFAVQGTSPTVVGTGGGGLGYAGVDGGISSSFALEFNVYNGSGTGSGSDFGVGIDGAIDHDINLVPYGINLSANPNDVYQATVTDSGPGTLTVSIWDITQNPATNPPNYTGTFSVPQIPIVTVANNVNIDGTGTVTLGGTNTYAGNTTVNAGTLLVDGQIVNPTVTVNAGGTLGGTGTVPTTIVQSGGSLSPGDAPGTITAANLTMTSGSTLVEELGGTAAGTFDQTVIEEGGTVTLGGALNISLVDGFLPARGEQFTIISNQGGSGVNGTFSQVNAPNGYVFAVNYAGDESGDDVVLTVIAVPITVASSTARVPANATTLTIDGTNFDTTAGNNTVTFNDGAAGTVTSATATTLTVTFSTQPTTAGSLTAVVTTDTVTSGAPVQVATVTPVVTTNTASLANTVTTLTIDGFGFDPTAGNNTVTFNDGAAGTVTSATATSLTVTFTTDPTTAGSLTAVATTDTVTSGSPVQVATVTTVSGAPTVTLNTSNLPANATTLTINGTGFASIAGNNTVTFNDGAAGTVTSATATSLTVTFTTDPTTAGSLTAVVTADSLTSGSPVQVATVTPVVTANTAGILQHAPTVTIHGYGFDPIAAHDAVTFNDGAAGTVTSATATTLVVTFTTAPTAAGSLTAVVTTDAITSGAAVQVATVTFVNGVTVNGDIAPIVDISSNGSGTVTATTDGNNGFTAGNTVVISGYTGANAGYDGTFTVQSASGDQFTVTNATPSLPTLSGNSAGFAISQNTASALRGNQRSMVDSVVYTFTSPIGLTASNFTLTTSTPSVSGAPSAAPAPATLYPGMALTSLAGGSIWVVTWVSGGGTGATVSGHSLADGVYNITLGNSNEGTDTFFRLYGNVIGFNSTSHTASLNNQDSLTFTHTYLLSTGATQYLADCDFDANGVINNTDSLNFTHRYLSVWSGFLPTI